MKYFYKNQYKTNLGETTHTPLSPASGGESPVGGPKISPGILEGDAEFSGSEGGERPRLQRCKAQSRNTFRLRRSRRNRVEVSSN